MVLIRDQHWWINQRRPIAALALLAAAVLLPELILPRAEVLTLIFIIT